jgi:hypothetical protein
VLRDGQRIRGGEIVLRRAVTELAYIKVKPGKFDDYMKYLDTTYKSLMEANKKAGLISDMASTLQHRERRKNPTSF